MTTYYIHAGDAYEGPVALNARISTATPEQALQILRDWIGALGAEIMIKAEDGSEDFLAIEINPAFLIEEQFDVYEEDDLVYDPPAGA